MSEHEQEWNRGYKAGFNNHHKGVTPFTKGFNAGVRDRFRALSKFRRERNDNGRGRGGRGRGRRGGNNRNGGRNVQQRRYTDEQNDTPAVLPTNQNKFASLSETNE